MCVVSIVRLPKMKTLFLGHPPLIDVRIVVALVASNLHNALASVSIKKMGLVILHPLVRFGK